MPQIQIIGNPERAPEPTGVQDFFSRLGKSYKDENDRVEIGKILGEYQSNREDANAWEKAVYDLEKSTISPSRRLEVQKTLNNTQKSIIERDKQLNKQVEKKQEEYESSKKRQALERSGATQQQLDLFDASPVGGQTKVVESIVEQQSREKTPPGIISPDVVDYDKGLTPAERVKRQDARYSTQTPLLMKNSESIHGLENESLSIGLLQELDASDRVGEGLQKLNINPKTGDLIIPQLGTPEEQLFVKTVNDFTVKAKDSFGARVTNFELDRFMQRLPTLANSKEGRALIMRQMQIVNELNQLEKKEIQKVFDQYGVRNIDYADAENKARRSIEGRKEELKKEYYNIEQVAKKEESEKLKSLRKNVPDGYTAMRKPDGSVKAYPNKNISNLEEKGYKKI